MVRHAGLALGLLLSWTLSSLPASAQRGGRTEVVKVTVTQLSILDNFLSRTQRTAISPFSAPITVEVPIGVAASVCGVSAQALSRLGDEAQCTAVSGSRALAQLVMRQIISQRRSF